MLAQGHAGRLPSPDLEVAIGLPSQHKACWGGQERARIVCTQLAPLQEAGQLPQVYYAFPVGAAEDDGDLGSINRPSQLQDARSFALLTKVA